MLAGTPPFDGDNALTIAMKQVKNDAAPLSEVRPDLPAAVCELIHRMIEKFPEKRPQSADEVLRVLKQINLDEAYALNDIKIAPVAIIDKNFRESSAHQTPTSDAGQSVRAIKYSFDWRTGSRGSCHRRLVWGKLAGEFGAAYRSTTDHGERRHPFRTTSAETRNGRPTI